MRLCSKGPVALAAAAALALVAGCDPYVKGNGVYTEEYRAKPEFQGVRVENGIQIVATSGVALQPVKVTGDANVVELIETDVEPQLVGTTTEIRVLHVHVRVGYDAIITPQVVVSVPSFTYVRARDASPVQVNQAAAPTFSVDASDTAVVTITGPGGDAIDATLGGGSLLEATEYLTTSAHVDLAGHATAKLRSSGPVTGTVANDSTLINFGTGHCDQVTTTAGTPTISCH